LILVRWAWNEMRWHSKGGAWIHNKQIKNVPTLCQRAVFTGYTDGVYIDLVKEVIIMDGALMMQLVSI